MVHQNGPVKVDLLSVDRSAADTLTVRWRLNNTQQQQVDPAGSMETGGFHPVSTVDGVSLIDVLAHKRYLPLRSTDDSCLCSIAANAKIDPGKSRDFYAVFPAPPAELQQITVAVPLTPVFADIPIGNKPRPVGPDEADPSKVQVKSPPPIIPLINTVEGAEASLDDDDVSRRVRLSADVLFAVNKADLTSRARVVLDEVAEQIDDSAGDIVTIDGHTDNSGNDAINDPLSERRARAVEDQLKGMVSRQGVQYRSEGHGSREPIADNGTAEGRQKNRRVVVTFARPKPAVAPPAATSAAPQWTGGSLPAIAAMQSQPVPNGLDTKDMRVEVNGLHRSSGGLVQAVWTLSNTGSGDIGLALWFNGDLMNYAGMNTGGAVIVDTANRLLYRPLRDASKGCLCTVYNLGNDKLSPGESVTLFDLYEVSAELTSVTMKIPGFAESQRIQIQ
jgi:outer membrane protein OmpA-like peptidoglycan-associated protein